MKIQFVFILIVSPAVLSVDHRYCRLASCPRPRSHTFCAFTVHNYGKNCKKQYQAGITDADKGDILYYHNMKRWPSMRGTADAYSLEWDTELADIAQRWAYQCPSSHDRCRNVDFFNVTQRIYKKELPKNEGEPKLSTAILKWYSLENESRRSFHHVNLGEATLVQETGRAWGNANRIGCGKVRISPKDQYGLYFVCNYGYTLIQRS